jgi:hypothetical protein
LLVLLELGPSPKNGNNRNTDGDDQYQKNGLIQHRRDDYTETQQNAYHT